MSNGSGIEKLTKILSFFAGLALLLAWLLPNHYFPWASAYNEFATFFGALLLSITLLAKPLRINRSGVLFIAMAAIPLLQYAAGIIFFWGDAFITSVYLFGFAAMLIVGYNIGMSTEQCQKAYRMLAYLFLTGSILSIGLALVQWLMLGNTYWIADLPPDGRPFANFAQPNMLASLLCIVLASTLYLFEIRKMQVASASFTALVLLFGIALTQSRTPWVNAVFAIVWWAWKSRDLNPRMSTKFMTGWIILYVALIFSIPLISAAIEVRTFKLLEHATSFERLGIWQQLVTAVLNGPLWGYGWNQVSVAQISIAQLSTTVSMTEHSHNILLDLILWNGPLLGIILIIALFTWGLRLAWGMRTIESVFGIMAVGFLIIHAMLEYPLDYAYFLLPAGLILGLVEADQLPQRTLTIPRPIYALVIASACVLYVKIWQEYRLIDEDTRLLRFEIARVGTLRAAQPAPDVTELTQLREYARFARTPPTAHMSKAKLEWMEKIAHRYPTKFALYRYNLALALNHQPNAQLELDRTRGMYGQLVYQQTLVKLAADMPKNQ